MYFFSLGTNCLMPVSYTSAASSFSHFSTSLALFRHQTSSPRYVPSTSQTRENHLMRDRGAVGGMAQNVALKGLQQLLCDASCVRYRAVGRVLVSAFLAVCFELVDVAFARSHSTRKHLLCPVEAGNRREEAPFYPKTQLPGFFSLTWMFWIFSLMENGCGAIALIAGLSQVYGETPPFRLLSLCSPESRRVFPHSAREMSALRKRITEPRPWRG
jgi:hypothetical protein